MKHVIFFLAASLLFVPSALAAWVVVRPQANSSGIETANQSFAFDNDPDTFMRLNITDQEVSFSTIGIGAHTDSEDVLRVDIILDMATSGLTNDLWAIAYADDNATSITYLRTYSSDNLARESLIFGDVQNFQLNNWSWTAVRDMLKIFIFATNDSVRDNGVLQAYDISANVTYDAESPTIAASGPANNTVYQLANWIVFTYTVQDLSTIQNCSLLLDNITNQTNDAPLRDTPQTFNVSFDNRNYSWAIACKDLPGFVGTTGTATFLMDANQEPAVENVLITPGIALIPGSSTFATCNASLKDLDGEEDIASVTARAYDALRTNGDVDESSSHLTNASCETVGTDSVYRNVTCGFPLWYYASPGSWTCNVTVTDANGTAGHSSAVTAVSETYGMNITAVAVSYGNVTTFENSTEDSSITIANAGNMPIDIGLHGYGVADPDGLAMACTAGNISVGYERYALASGMSYGLMTSLNASSFVLADFDLAPKNDSFSGEKVLFWKIGVPPGPDGNCSGFVVVTALAT